MEQEEKSQPHYDASKIEILESCEAVRRRPGMYIGATDQRGLQVLLRYTIEGLMRAYDFLDQALRHVTVRFEQDGSATVICGGPTLDKAFLEQFAPFLLKDLNVSMRTYLFILSALSERLSVTIRAPHGRWRTLLLEQGLLRGDEFHSVVPDENCDIWLRFWPDFTLLDQAEFNVQLTQEMIRTSYCSAVQDQIILVDARS